MKTYKSSPLPFQGQKRTSIKHFLEALKNFPEDAIYVDLFGGSGLLSHNIKRFYPNARVIYNDYDNFSERIFNIEKTNILIDRIKPLVSVVKTNDKIPKENHLEIIKILEEEKSFDYITISAQLFFGGTYAKNLEMIKNYKNFFNKIVKSNYKADGYLHDLEIVNKDWHILFNEFKENKNVVFIFDPPYMTTDVKSYNSGYHWKITEFLEIVKSLYGIKKFFYFTSHRGGLIELFEFLEKEFSIKNPFADCKKTKITNSAINSVYDDFMFFKN